MFKLLGIITGLGIGLIAGYISYSGEVPLWLGQSVELITGPEPIKTTNRAHDKLSHKAIQDRPLVTPLFASGRTMLPADEYENIFEPTVTVADLEEQSIDAAMAMPPSQKNKQSIVLTEKENDITGTVKASKLNESDHLVQDAPAIIVDAAVESSQVDDGALWQPIWRAFRSQSSADGFSSRLENDSGVALRVRQLSTNRFHVGFMYQDDRQREARLQEIAANSGLSRDLLVSP